MRFPTTGRQRKLPNLHNLQSRLIWEWQTPNHWLGHTCSTEPFLAVSTYRKKNTFTSNTWKTQKELMWNTAYSRIDGCDMFRLRLIYSSQWTAITGYLS